MEYLRKIFNYVIQKPLRSIGIGVGSLLGLYLLLVGFLFGGVNPVINWYAWSTIRETKAFLTKQQKQDKYMTPDRPLYNTPLSERVDNPRKHNEMKAEIREARSEFSDVYRAKLENKDVSNVELLKKMENYLKKVKAFVNEFPDDPGPIAYKINSFKSRFRTYIAIGEKEKAFEILDKAMDYIHSIPQEHFYHQAVSARVQKTKDQIREYRKRYGESE